MSWKETKDYYDNRCGYCYKQLGRLTKDHMYPKSKGGESKTNNFVPACNECNQKKGDSPIWTMLLQ